MRKTTSIRHALRSRGLEHLAARTAFWWHHLEQSAPPFGNAWAWRFAGSDQWAATVAGDAAGKAIFDPRSRQVEMVPAGSLGFGAPQEPARTQLQRRGLLTGGTTSPTGWTLIDASGLASSGTISMLGSNDGAQAWRMQAAGGQMHLAGASITFAPNTRYALSLWVEALDYVGGDTVLAGLSDSSFIASGAATIEATDPELAELPARVVRVFTTDGSGGSASLRMGAGVGGSATADVTLSRPQIEAGDYASTWMPNDTDASLARATDAMRWTDAGFFTRIAPAGTLLWIGRAPYGVANLSGLERIVALNEGLTTSNRVMLYANEAQDRLTAQIRNGAGATTMQLNADLLGAFAARQTLAAAVTWDATGGAFYVNGLREGTAAAMTPPSAFDVVEIGSSDSANGRSGAECFQVSIFEEVLTEMDARNLTRNPDDWIWRP